jgi:hypothetical protein
VEIFTHRPEHHAQGVREPVGRWRQLSPHSQLPAGVGSGAGGVAFGERRPATSQLRA